MGTLESTETALPAPAAAVAPSAAAEPALPKRRRLAKAFERPLDKVLREKSEAVVAAPKKSEKATVRDGFTFPKAEHDRLVELKKLLAGQGIDATQFRMKKLLPSWKRMQRTLTIHNPWRDLQQLGRCGCSLIIHKST